MTDTGPTGTATGTFGPRRRRVRGKSGLCGREPAPFGPILTADARRALVRGVEGGDGTEGLLGLPGQVGLGGPAPAGRGRRNQVPPLSPDLPAPTSPIKESLSKFRPLDLLAYSIGVRQFPPPTPAFALCGDVSGERLNGRDLATLDLRHPPWAVPRRRMSSGRGNVAPWSMSRTGAARPTATA